MDPQRPASPRRGIPLGLILAAMLTSQAIVAWVFAGVLFPGLL